MLNIDHMSWFMIHECQMPNARTKGRTIKCSVTKWHVRDYYYSYETCDLIQVLVQQFWFTSTILCVFVCVRARVQCLHGTFFARYEIQYFIRKRNNLFQQFIQFTILNMSIEHVIKPPDFYCYFPFISAEFPDFWWICETFLFQSSHMTIITNKQIITKSMIITLNLSS